MKNPTLTTEQKKRLVDFLDALMEADFKNEKDGKEGSDDNK